MIDLLDIQDARLLAETRAKMWQNEFEAEYNAPQIEMNKALFWQEFVPPEVKENMKQRIPGVVKRFDKRYGGK